MKPGNLESFRAWIERVRPLLCEQLIPLTPMAELEEMLRIHSRLVVILNHGPMLGPAPALIGMAELMLRAGGGQRYPFGITWRGFYRLPGMRTFMQWFTQTDEPPNVDSATQRLKEGPWTDCCIMPEGELCNVGNGVDVQPFLSSRFVEIAVRAGCPVLLLAHHGSGQLARTLSLPDSLAGAGRFLPKHLGRRLQQTRTLSVPWLLQPRLKALRVDWELFWPELEEADLEGPDAEQRVNAQGRKARARLQLMVNRLVLDAEH
ncbi:hypothetical protein QQM79_09320 [Marinobacteraceae bacterium S3BR75-40.1]